MLQQGKISESRPKLFLSYARKDGEAFATALRQRLEREHPAFTLWQDRAEMEGGVGWWKQIEAALDQAQFIVIVMTPRALASEITRKEWRYARQRGVIVYPVKGVPDEQLDFASVPNWMRKAHWFDLDKEWETFIRHLQSHHERRCVPFMAPDKPGWSVERPAEFDQLLGHLVAVDRQDPMANTTALVGAGGFGKTTLAIALCHHDDVMAAFDDGILWATLGEQPDVQLQITKLYAALTGERPVFLDVEESARELAWKLENRNCLLVVDDVWDATHLRFFLRGAEGCARLITTRQFDVLAEAHTEARRVNVDQMTGPEAVAVLIHGLETGPTDRAPFLALARRLSEWPLLLGLANGAMRQRIARGDTIARTLEFLGQALDRQGMTAFDQRNASARHAAVSKTVEVSLDLLTAGEREHYRELAIFPKDTDIPLSAVGTLWGKDPFETERLVTTLANFSLLKFDLRGGTLRLHDVLRSYLVGQGADLRAMHRRLLARWEDFHALPDQYAWQWLGYHLIQAGQPTQLRELLFDFNWLQAKLEATDVVVLMADYDHHRAAEEVRLVQDAIRLSSHAVGRDNTQFASQLVGRLREEDSAAFAGLLEGARCWRGATWLCPLNANLYPPGTALLRKLQGHADRVGTLALSADGLRAVSGSRDTTLKVWDVERGRELRTLRGHPGPVNAVALSADGLRAVSGSEDMTLKVWDVESGRELGRLQGHAGPVSAVALSADGLRAVSGSHDTTLKVWDVERGLELRTLQGHAGWVTTVALSANGRRAVSGSWDATLRVWDVETGRELQTFKGDAGLVRAVVLSADGRQAVSASDAQTLKVWDVETGRELRMLTGHTGAAWAVALSANGQRAVSGDSAQTLKLWDVETGRELRTFEGHAREISAVAVSADGRRAVSASFDQTLLVWDLESKRELRRFQGHASWIRSVAVSADGRRAVSGSLDKTLKAWNVERGRELWSLQGHENVVSAVALSADGRLALSGSEDTTLKVWDVETGRELRTLQGHAGWVDAVALSADGRRAASGSWDKTLKLWDLGSGRELWTLQGHADVVSAVALSADGRWALSGSLDHTLKVWDAESGRELRTLRGHSVGINTVALSADGRIAVSGSSDWKLKIWNVESGRELRTLEGHGDGVHAVALSANGRRVVSGSLDQTLKVWDLESGKCLATFTGEGTMFGCALASDGLTIVAGDQSGRIHFLRLILMEGSGAESGFMLPHVPATEPVRAQSPWQKWFASLLRRKPV